MSSVAPIFAIIAVAAAVCGFFVIACVRLIAQQAIELRDDRYAQYHRLPTVNSWGPTSWSALRARQ